ncbi:hypothetical protein H0H92_015639 [Tricholoma furcatifolium]|nr:hypothetical protein H0H92_015639 [Tricholoma furcatifolium]
MGRRAKSFTHSEAVQASKLRQKCYAQTERCRQHRRAVNRRSYLKLKLRPAATSAAPASLEPPILPETLYEMAEFPIPQSYSFKESFASSEWYEDSDWRDEALQLWDSLPPYTQLPSGDFEQFSDVLLGYRLRKQMEEETARLNRYQDHADCDFSSDIHTELVAGYERWKESLLVVEKLTKGFARDLGVKWLEWQARRVWHLEQDFLSLSQGLDALIRLFVDRWTAIR